MCSATDHNNSQIGSIRQLSLWERPEGKCIFRKISGWLQHHGEPARAYRKTDLYCYIYTVTYLVLLTVSSVLKISCRSHHVIVQGVNKVSVLKRPRPRPKSRTLLQISCSLSLSTAGQYIEDKMEDWIGVSNGWTKQRLGYIKLFHTILMYGSKWLRLRESDEEKILFWQQKWDGSGLGRVLGLTRRDRLWNKVTRENLRRTETIVEKIKKRRLK